MLAGRTSLSSQQLGAAFSAGDKEAGESTSIALFAGDVVARGAGPATLVALPLRPPDAKPVVIVDQPTCFEDLGATLVSLRSSLSTTCASTACPRQRRLRAAAATRGGRTPRRGGTRRRCVLVFPHEH